MRLKGPLHSEQAVGDVSGINFRGYGGRAIAQRKRSQKAFKDKGLSHWDLNEIPDLEDWLDSRYGLTLVPSGPNQMVSAWRSIGGNGETFQQVSPIRRPLYLRSQLGSALLPIISFDGLNSIIEHQGAHVYPQPFSLAIYMKEPGAIPLTQTWVDFGNAGSVCRVGYQDVVNQRYTMNWGTARIGSVGGSAGYSCIIYSCDHGSSQMFINGIAEPIPSSPGANGTLFFFIGGRSNFTNFAVMKVASVAFFTRSLTTLERSLINTYWRSIYL